MKNKTISKKPISFSGDSMTEENLLDYLLRYSDPASDLHAKELLNTFGNLAEVLDANVKDLEEIGTLNQESLALIRLVSEIHRRYLLIRSRSDLFLKDRTDIANYLMPLFAGEKNEVAYLLSMNGARMVIGCTKLSSGSEDRVNLDFKYLVKEAIRLSPKYIVLAHNHPAGLAGPSQEDIYTTSVVRDLLKPMDITLLDHMVFTSYTYISMQECGYLRIAY